MKVLKAIALTLLTLILFLALCVFGAAYTVNNTVLNDRLALKTLNEVDFPQVIQENVNKQADDGNITPDVQAALIVALDDAAPVLKQRIGTAVDDSYTYLNGNSTTPDLKAVLSNTVANPQFVTDLLAKFDIAVWVNQAFKEQSDTGAFDTLFKTSVVSAVAKSEPDIKIQIAAGSDPLFKYLLMQSSGFDLKTTVRQTVLNDSMVSEIMSNMDTSALTREILNEDIGTQLPDGIQLSSQQTDRLVAALQPSIETTLTGMSGAFADYLLGIKPNLTANFSLTSIMPVLKTVVKEAFLAQLTADEKSLPQDQLDAAFETYYADFAKTLPTAFTFNFSNLNAAFSTDIAEDIANAQTMINDARNNIDSASTDYATSLNDAKTAAKDFRSGYIALIALLIILVAAIILIHRRVAAACLNLGIVFLIFGAVELTAAIIAKNIGLQQIAKMDVPNSLSTIPGLILNDVLAPLRMVSIIGLIIGAVLIATAIIYPRLKPGTKPIATTD
jgi:hypothetical protein